MDTLTAMGIALGVITIAFVALLLYRWSLTSKEGDWIPLTDDAKEDSAIKAQTDIEMKAKKLTIPIRTVGALWVVLLLALIGFWVYHMLSNPPPMPQ